MPKFWNEQNTDRAAVVLGFTAVFLRLWLGWFAIGIPPDTENMNVGVALATRGYFGDPFFTPTGPTAHVAPLYPWLIAAAIRVTGSITTGFMLARSALALLIGLTIVSLPRIAVALGFRREAGLLAGMALCVPSPPVFLWLEVTGQHETVITAASLAVLVATTFWCVVGGRLSTRNSALLGIGWGIGLHASPTLLLPMLAMIIGPALLKSEYRSPIRRASPVFMLGFALALTPWMIRNIFVMGGPELVRDNFGMELAMSNGDGATPDMRENMYEGRSMTRHPYFNAAAALELRTTGEREYYRQRQVEAVRWIGKHPGAFLQLTMARIRLFFLPKLGLEYHAYFYIPLVSLWILGSIHFARTDRLGAVILNAALLAYAAPHFVVQSSPRYSYPVLWIMLLFASHMLLVTTSRILLMVGQSQAASKASTL